MKDSQPLPHAPGSLIKYIEANNERFSTKAVAALAQA